ncbi:hypothetical protein JOD69_002220 [Methylocaldum sp. RMAD-M]|jgi:hypothetical protein|nr:hypothetical protein [Methylocaldum sp. RMAD-M]
MQDAVPFAAISRFRFSEPEVLSGQLPNGTLSRLLTEK